MVSAQRSGTPPDRVLLRAANGVSRSLGAALARHIMQVHYSEIGSVDDAKAFASAILERETIRLKPKRDMLKGHDDPEAERWRDRDWANARADDFLKKCRAAERKLTANVPADADDATSDLYWLIRMTTAWFVILDPSRYSGDGDPLVAATHLAAQVGETDYFERVMKPYFSRTLSAAIIFRTPRLSFRATSS